MACNSDYMEPTGREKSLQRTARLYGWLLQHLGRRVPVWVQKDSHNPYLTNDRAVTKLCATMHEINGAIPGEKSAQSLGNQLMWADLDKWWVEHQIADRTREKGEDMTQARERRRLVALAKLTDEDRLVLGLHTD